MENSLSPSLDGTPEVRTTYVYLVSMVAAMGGFLFGYDLGIVVGSVIFLKTGFHLSPGQVGFAVSCAALGCVLGPLAGGPVADWLGRKKTLGLTALIFAVGTIGTVIPRNIIQFDAFRIVGGLGVGLASVTSPMYIAEISPAHLRGRLVTVNQLAIVTGSLLSVAVSYFLSFSGNWRGMFASELVPVFLFVLGLMLIPESPRWLFEKNRVPEALSVLGKIYKSASFVEKECRGILDMTREEPGRFVDLFRPGIRKALLIAVTLAVLQQMTGASPLTFYLPVIFQQAGFNKASDALLQTVILYVWFFLVTLLSMWLIDRIGRRPLLLAGTFGMAVTLLVVGAAFYHHVTGIAVVILMMVCIGFYIASLAPLTWLIMSEIFPTRHRGKAMGLASVCLWISVFISVQAVPMLSAYTEKNFGSIAGVFWLFAIVCVGGFIFSWKMVPETKGRSLEEIASSWTRHIA